ncbi:MAG: cell division protein FtsZ [Dehalococcoidia bacterium]|nr:cell division protein FtsZ [Dehalococcoidia bacterium]
MTNSPGSLSGPSFSGDMQEGPASIAVVGVGGGGCNAVMRIMRERTVPGVKYVCVNTDVKSLNSVRGATVVQIGEQVTRGMGAGGNPEVGRDAAEKDRVNLHRAIGHPDLIFLTAGMGGGTGTGAAPVVAAIAKQTGALVVGLVTTPFSWEGSRRLASAMAGVGRLQESVDSLIVIHNDRLLQLLNKDVSMEEALRRADEAVMYGVLSVAELVNVPGEINVDLADVKTILALPGRALMAMGEAPEPNGALEAAKTAISNPLLDLSIDGAQGVLFCINGGPKLSLGEVNAAGELIASKVSPKSIVFFGMVNDEKMQDRVRITLIATGIPESNGRAKERSAWEGQASSTARQGTSTGVGSKARS